MKGPELCKVTDNRLIAGGMYKLRLEAPNVAGNARPGQFIHIKVPGDRSRLLRRPISIYDACHKKGYVEIVFQVVGEGTRLLSAVKTGDFLDVLGPLGNGFSVSGDTRHLFVVGGGCGAAPVKFAASRFNFTGRSCFIGFKSGDAAYDLQEFENSCDSLLIATEDGSIGYKGLITEVLEDELKRNLPDLMLACGPVPMMKAIQQMAEKYRVPCQLLLEERMGCGIGACMTCACAVRDDEDGFIYKRVCKDGPVFWSREVMLDEA